MKESIKKRIEAVRHGEVPEGYRRTKDIGIAPSDWRVGQLSDVLHNKQRPVPKPDEPYWRLGIRSWAKGTFHAYVDDPAAVDMDELYVVQENDLVVNITFAWEHAIAVASKEDDGLLVSHRFPTYTFDGGNVPEYYKAVVSQQFFRDMLDHISPGGAGRNRVLNRKDFLALPCHIPPIAEQKKIAEILSTCDRVIELKQQLLEEKRRQKQWLMQKLMNPNGGLRLPGFKEAWTSTQFGEIVTRSKNMISAPKCKKGTKCIELEHIEGGSGRLLGYCNAETQESNKCQFSTGDILFGKLRPYLQKALKAPFDGVCSSEIWVLRPCLDVVCNDYLFYIVQSDRFMLIANTSSGTKMPRAEWSLVQNFVVELPTIAEQKAIANTLAAADQEITLLNAELEVWQQKKKALMQLLLTGLVRVNA